MEEGPISRKEVAKRAGVSEATVSRVLSGGGLVREATRRKVEEAAAQLGYVPNALAQRFARRKSGNLGVIVPVVPKVRLFSTYYFSEILSGIGETAKLAGYDLLLMFLAPDEPRNYDLLFRTQKIDACIMLGTQDTPEERTALAGLQREGHAFCLVNQRFEGEAFPTVEADHVQGSVAAVSHLIAQGCTKVAFLNGPISYSNSVDRLRGYQQALQQHGLAPDPALQFSGNYSRTSGYANAKAIAGAIRDGRIDGVFAANDRMAIGLLQGLREEQITPGQDVALIGYDDSEGSQLTDPQLSSVAVPFYDLGAIAASRLLQSEGQQRASDERQAVADKLEVQLVLRASTLMYRV
ncbi:LacI family transcriptional regulator [Paenibacillaceae bacterium]|nr:LacI family transcriptional regulator [Paenibacillaceae bacterium]